MNPSESIDRPPTGSIPVACTLGRGDLAVQGTRWRRLRSEAGLDRLALDDGLRLTFRDEPRVEQELRALTAVENECCSWATWDVARDDGVLVMEARATGDGVAALQAMFVD